MDNRFQIIGFQVDNSQQLEDLISQAADKCDRIDLPGSDSYLYCRTQEGCELWIDSRENGRIKGCRPHFFGRSRYRVKIIGRQKAEETALSGLLVAETIEETPGMPLIVDLPNYHQQAVDLSLPREAVLQITAFSSQAYVYDSDRDFAMSRHGSMDPNGSMIPRGAYQSGEDQEKKALEPTTILSGRIRSVQCLRNSFSGRLFYALEVKTVGGVLDVVVNPEDLTNEPKINGIIAGLFHLAGRIISPRIQSLEGGIYTIDFEDKTWKEQVKAAYHKYVDSREFKSEFKDEVMSVSKRLLTGILLLVPSLIILAAALLVSESPIEQLLWLISCGLLILSCYLIVSSIRIRQAEFEKLYNIEKEFAAAAEPLKVYGLIISRFLPEGKTRRAASLVIGSFEDNLSSSEITAIIEKIFELKVAPEGEDKHFVSALFENLRYQKNRRRIIPYSIAGANQIYVFDLKIRYTYLPEELTDPVCFLCMAQKSAEGLIRQIPDRILRNL